MQQKSDCSGIFRNLKSDPSCLVLQAGSQERLFAAYLWPQMDVMFVSFTNDSRDVL